MAQRRMFSPQIVDSDAFLDMSASAQCLYFHLGMRADDDGFVGNPRKILRMVGGNDDDLKLLEAKRFVISFESGVLVIKHWRINNLIRKDWHKDTVYSEEFKQLKVKDNGAYTELVNESLPIRSRSIDKYSVVKNSVVKDTEETSVGKEINEIIDLFKGINPTHDRLFGQKPQRQATERLLKKLGREKLEQIINSLKMSNSMDYAPQIFTPYELEKKLGKLVAFVQKKNTSNLVIKI